MITPKYEWKKQDLPEKENIDEIATELGLSPLVTEILVARGQDTVAKIKRFLEPTSESFYDPYQLFDMQRAIERIQDAIVNEEHITVYGDYDVDGLTSTAIMYEALLQLGADVDYYIPDRFQDGYGPNKAVYARLLEQGTELLVTVDNGVAGLEAITYAKEQGLDVIVTDHHELPAQLPPAYAVIHPRHPKGDYPFADLSGAGVAFKMAQAMLEEIPEDFLDLAALGTIADLVSLTDENRALAKFGLVALENTLRPGLLALYELAGLNEKEITEQTVGFTLAPRLNAIGRMQHAQIGVELLTTLDEERAQELAKKAQALNAKRQEIVEKITTEALAKVAKAPGHLVDVVAGTDWHEGVLGIVASRLVEKTGRPAVVLNLANGEAKGSGRSVEAFHLFDALDGHREFLESFGGHHMACGVTVLQTNIEKLQQILDTEAKHQKLDQAKAQALAIVSSLSLSEVDLNLLDELAKLAPFGTGNELPLFEINDHQVVSAKAIGKNNDHLRLELKNGATEITALAFGVKEELPELLQAPADIQFVASLAKNEWRGQVKPQLLIKDLSLAEKHAKVVIERKVKLTQEMFLRPVTYGFFNPQLAQKLRPHLPALAQCLVFDENLTTTNLDELVLVDLPANLAQLEFVLKRVRPKTMRVHFYTKKQEVLLPTRAEFGKVYKLMQRYQKITFPADLAALAKTCALEDDQALLILKVFFEAGFVTINKGILSFNASAKAHRLEDTPSYQSQRARQQVVATLLKSDEGTLKHWLSARS